MTNEELENKAYLVATGNFLTERLSFEEFESISEQDLMGLVWEPLENLRHDELVDIIVCAAHSVIEEFKDT